VYDNISRYKYIVGLSDNIKNKVEELPVTLSYEISKEKCPDFIREQVISGEIKTKSALQIAIKSFEPERKIDIEIDEDKISPEEEFIKIAKLLNELRNKMNGVATRKEVNELKKVSKILEGIKI
jgi:2,3-bisphosphoglycerate-independent phosphoglycerate mutase